MTSETQNLRALAQEYAQAARSEKNLAIPAAYRRHNALEIVRPPVLVFEEPWGEFDDCEPLRPLSTDPILRGMEVKMRRDLYKLRHYPGDYAIHPFWRVEIPTVSTGIGITVREKAQALGGGSYVKSHIYEDVLPDESALGAIKLPALSVDEALWKARLERAEELFDGIMPVKSCGYPLNFPIWDDIPRYHGVENSLTDIAERPEFVHEIVEKFTRIYERYIDEYERLNLLDTGMYYVHCTPACCDELPEKDREREKITAKDVWGRSMAQVFAAVSPATREEFDIEYQLRLLPRCGLAYYGCCEPLDRQIDLLRRIPNLRRVSVTPWADPDRAADSIGGDFVMSAKSNPAFVAGSFDPAPVEAETRRILAAAKRNSTPVEFILKDISTVGGDPKNLTRWVDTVNRVIDESF